MKVSFTYIILEVTFIKLHYVLVASNVSAFKTNNEIDIKKIKCIDYPSL